MSTMTPSTGMEHKESVYPLYTSKARICFLKLCFIIQGTEAGIEISKNLAVFH